MPIYTTTLKDQNNNDILPKTVTSSVVLADGTTTLDGELTDINNLLDTAVFAENGELSTEVTISADTVLIDDIEEYFTSTHVEGVLQEIGDDLLEKMNLDGSNSDIDKLSFDITPSTDALAQGKLRWNSSDRTVDIGLGNDVVLQIGQEQHFMVRNQTGSTIADGVAVYDCGETAGSGRIEACPMIADGSINGFRFIGVTTENVSSGVNGLVTSFGYVRGLDTRGTAYGENWAVGDILYVSQTVAGRLTNIKPTLQVIIVARVITRHETNGTILVRPTFIDWYNKDETDGFTSNIQTQLNNKADKSTTTTAILFAESWVGVSAPYTYTLTVNNGVTTTSNQELLPTTDITGEQINQLLAANIQDAGQSTNTINLKSFGTKPTIDLPIRIILRGDA